MGIETDLNVSPYYDDANNAINANYHRVLFRPKVPVQARELTQLQDILQNQIERFGENIFVTGSIIKGCNFSFDNNYHYAKILDNRPIDGQVVAPSQYVGLIASEATSNLYAIVYNYADGYESQDPDLKTLYFKYLNSGANGETTFSSASQLRFYTTSDVGTAAANGGINSSLYANGDVTIASVTNAIGKAYAMTVSSGVIFQKGHFVQVPANETVVVEKYSQYPGNKVAGFLVEESIVTELEDTNLLDSAIGYSNYNAPGAHRLKLTPTLVAYDANSAPANNFFALVEWQNGNITRSFQQTQYSVIGDEMARREFETNGNFVVKPFHVTMQDANSTHNFAVVSAGLAYIDGHRVEQLNNIYVPVRKGIDAREIPGLAVQTEYDNSILVGEKIGSVPTHVGAEITLRDDSGRKISTGQYSNTDPAGNEIGRAKALAVRHHSGTVGAHDALYKVHLTDIKMNLGKNFKDVKAIHYDGGAGGNAHADVARSIDPTKNTHVTKVQNASKSPLVFSTGKRGLIGFSNTASHIYRTVSNTVVTANNGYSNLIELTDDEFPYTANGVISTEEQASIVVIPTSFDGNSSITFANVDLTPSGNVAVTVNSTVNNVVTGTSTQFTKHYQVGDHISVANTFRRITSISNNTFMTVDRAWSSNNSNQSHRKTYPVNVPVNIHQRNSDIEVQSDKKHMKINLRAANGMTEKLTANMHIRVHHNAKQPNAPDRNLEANTHIKIRINTADHENGTEGPWCLGIPHVYKIHKVHKSSNTGTILANTQSGNAYILTDTTGLANGVFLHGRGIPGGASANVVNSTALLLLSSNVATVTANNSRLKWGYFSEDDDKDDVTSSFKHDSGQKDGFHDHGHLKKDPSKMDTPIANGDLLTVTFHAFKPQNARRGYISADSYTKLVNEKKIKHEDIPAHVTKGGKEHHLRDSVDFRPWVKNTASYSNSITTATLNPACNTTFVDPATGDANTDLVIPPPDVDFEHTVTHYVQRIDKLVLNSYGKFQVIEGQPSNNPKPPADIKGTMTLATINVPPYPSYVSSFKNNNVALSYVTTTMAQQNKVYTMKDIAKLDKRVDNLEYYTSLNMLEQKTSTLTIASDVTGANRFKNGIFVDNFETTEMLDTQNPEYKIDLSSSESALVPRYSYGAYSIRFANGTGTTSNGGIITLAKSGTSEVAVITQNTATEETKTGDTAYHYHGHVHVHPKHDTVPDTKPHEPRHKPTAPKIKEPVANTATFSGGFSSNVYNSGLNERVYWTISGTGYQSMSVAVAGPGLYTYTETLKPVANGQYAASMYIPDPYSGYTGAWSITVTRTPKAGYTEVLDDTFVANSVVRPPRCGVTPDMGGIGLTTGILDTSLIVDTTTRVRTPVQLPVANTTVANGVLTLPVSNTTSTPLTNAAFNLDLLDVDQPEVNTGPGSSGALMGPSVGGIVGTGGTSDRGHIHSV